jgi:hypothetical protein
MRAGREVHLPIRLRIRLPIRLRMTRRNLTQNRTYLKRSRIDKRPFQTGGGVTRLNSLTSCKRAGRRCIGNKGLYYTYRTPSIGGYIYA